MQDADKTKEQLVAELHGLRERVAELEGDKAEPKGLEGLPQTLLHRFYTVLSSLYAGVLLVTEAGRVEFANRSFCDLFRLKGSPAELKGKFFAEIIDQIQTAYADPVAAINRIQETLDQDLPIKCEEVSLRDGRTCLRDFIPLDIEGKRFGHLWHHQDITERKWAEEALRDSQDRLNLALKSSRAGTWDRDIAADKATWDEHLHALFGLLPGSFSGRLEDFLGMVHPDDRERVRGEMTAAMDGDADYSTTYRVIWPDSSVHYIADRGRVYADSAGRPVRMIGVNLDVTEMKQAEEVLRDNERKFHSIFDSMSEMVALHELIRDATGRPVDYRILDCNPAFTRITGIPVEKAVGVLASQLYELSEPPYLESYAQVALTGQPMQFEVYFAPLQKHFAISAVSPAPGRFATVSTDITDLKRAEEALRENEEKYRSLFEHSQDAILLTLPDGSILDANQAACRMFGRSLEAIKNAGRSGLVDPTDPRLHTALSERALTGETNAEITMLRANGDRFAVEITSTVFVDASGQQKTSMIIRDISERKRSEEALKERDIQFKKLALHVPGMIYQFMKRPDGTYCCPFTTEAIKDVFGCSPQDVREDFSPIARVVLPEDLDKVIGSIESSADHMSAWQCEYRVQIPGRPIRWIFGRSTPEKLADGSILWHGFNTDITERKHAEEELSISSDRLSRAEIISRSGNWEFDLESKRVFASDGARRIYGLLNKEWTIPEVQKIPLPEYRDMLDRALRDLINESRPYDVEFRILRPDTGEIADIHSVAEYDPRRKVVFGIIQDITEHKRAEKARRQAEEKYRSIFENALEGIYQVTVGGRVLSCNPALARILGYDSPEELMNTITDIAGQLYVHPERRAELLQLIEKRGEAKAFQAQFFRKDKSVAWVSINVRAVRDKRGELACLEGILQDVTEHKAMESRLFESQKLEAVGTLAGGIAHDFNNILAAIIGYTEIAKGKLQQVELRPYLDQVLRAGDRAKTLVTQILAFSRKAEKEIKPVDISLLITEALRLLRATIPSTIEIHQEIAPSVGEVFADPIQLHQVVMNLCTNAAHAMREKGGVLEVGLSNAEIPPDLLRLYPDLKPGPYVKLWVNDTGTGIAPGIMTNIFDPFFTTKKKGEGTGLGLSVVYGIVKECGGTITVQSELGKGSTFSIYLPAIEHGAELTGELSSNIPEGKERIIFVDDEDSLAEMGREILEGLGYEVIAPKSSASALETFRAQPDRFDLVVTDMTMPGMTGKELATELLRIRPDIPIILCTGFSEIITEEEAKSVGIREFAMKPLNIRSIAALVRKVLDKKES